MDIREQLTQRERNGISNMLQRIATEDALRIALEKMGYSGVDLERNLKETHEAFRKLWMIV